MRRSTRVFLPHVVLALVVSQALACGDSADGDNPGDGPGPQTSACAAHAAQDDGAGDDCSFNGAEDCMAVECLCADGARISTRSCFNGSCQGRDGCDDACADNSGNMCTGSCSDGAQNGDETGTDCGGRCGACQAAPRCDDGVKNGNEDGVDCGGSCSACQVAARCDDGVKNGNEEGVDCGGSCSACQSGPSCDDGIKNGSEEGVDCGGSCSACAAKSCKQVERCSKHRTASACDARDACISNSEQCGHACEAYDPESASYLSCVAVSGNLQCNYEGSTDVDECNSSAACAWYSDCVGYCDNYDEESCRTAEGCAWR